MHLHVHCKTFWSFEAKGSLHKRTSSEQHSSFGGVGNGARAVLCNQLGDVICGIPVESLLHTCFEPFSLNVRMTACKLRVRYELVRDRPSKHSCLQMEDRNERIIHDEMYSCQRLSASSTEHDAPLGIKCCCSTRRRY